MGALTKGRYLSMGFVFLVYCTTSTTSKGKIKVLKTFLNNYLSQCKRYLFQTMIAANVFIGIGQSIPMRIGYPHFLCFCKFASSFCTCCRKMLENVYQLAIRLFLTMKFSKDIF